VALAKRIGGSAPGDSTRRPSRKALLRRPDHAPAVRFVAFVVWKYLRRGESAGSLSSMLRVYR